MAKNTLRGMIQRDAVMILMTLLKKQSYTVDDYIEVGWGSKSSFFEAIQYLRDAIYDLNLPYMLEMNKENEYSLFKSNEEVKVESFYDLTDEIKNKYTMIILMYMFNRRIKMDMGILRFIAPNKSDKTIRRTVESLSIIYESCYDNRHIESIRDGRKYYYKLVKM